jgi:hypothetical protein
MMHCTEFGHQYDKLKPGKIRTGILPQTKKGKEEFESRQRETSPLFPQAMVAQESRPFASKAKVTLPSPSMALNINPVPFKPQPSGATRVSPVSRETELSVPGTKRMRGAGPVPTMIPEELAQQLRQDASLSHSTPFFAASMDPSTDMSKASQIHVPTPMSQSFPAAAMVSPASLRLSSSIFSAIPYSLTRTPSNEVGNLFHEGDDPPALPQWDPPMAQTERIVFDRMSSLSSWTGDVSAADPQTSQENQAFKQNSP